MAGLDFGNFKQLERAMDLGGVNSGGGFNFGNIGSTLSSGLGNASSFLQDNAQGINAFTGLASLPLQYIQGQRQAQNAQDLLNLQRQQLDLANQERQRQLGIQARADEQSAAASAAALSPEEIERRRRQFGLVSGLGTV